jgi:hypothetical protein
MRRVALQFEIVLGGNQTADVTSADVVASIGTFADGLLADLQLPAAVDVQVAQGQAGRRVGLRLDGAPFRVPLDLGRASDQDALVLALCRAIHANRLQLATNRVMQALWENAGHASPPPEEFIRLVRRLVKHHVAVTRLGSGLSEWHMLDPDRAFEEAFAGIGGVITLEMSPAQYTRIMQRDGAQRAPVEQGEQGEAQTFLQRLRMMSDGLFYELGGLFAPCHVRPVDDIAGQKARVCINDARCYDIPVIGPEELLVNATGDRLVLLGVAGREARNPANGEECAIVPASARHACEDAGLTTWDEADCIVLATSSVLRRNASSLLPLDVVEYSLNTLSEAFPAITRRLPVERVARVLRFLLDEEISIRNLRGILETLLLPLPVSNADFGTYIAFAGGNFRPPVAWVDATVERDTVMLGEAVRADMRRYISHKYTRGANTLIVYLLDRDIEFRLRQDRPLSDAERAEFIGAVEMEVGSLPPTSQNPVILTTNEVRARTRREVEREFPYLAVLSYQELSPDMNIQPIARISLE